MRLLAVFLVLIVIVIACSDSSVVRIVPKSQYSRYTHIARKLALIISGKNALRLRKIVAITRTGNQVDIVFRSVPTTCDPKMGFPQPRKCPRLKNNLVVGCLGRVKLLGGSLKRVKYPNRKSMTCVVYSLRHPRPTTRPR
ncbi:hypothetical protein MTO96_007214 [Rhipicephalus appendiculatus]|uniref:Cystatin n=1 Tax=Rhipicephalus appendiculatus TaxID=34631 RepID=A0A131YTA9_RHIAP